jgi:hypothetical protein
MTIQNTLNEGNERFDLLVITLFENKLLFNMQCLLVNYVLIVDLININKIEDDLIMKIYRSMMMFR